MEKLYLALELSANTWKLGFSSPPHPKTRVKDVPARDWQAFQTAVDKAVTFFELTQPEILSCYEAGRDGFWIHRELTTRNITNLVVESSSIEVDRKKRKAKTDQIDVYSLLKLLKRHDGEDEFVFKVVEVPTPEDEDERHLSRELEAAKGERTSLSNQIKSLLITQGISLSTLKNFDKEIDRLVDGSGHPLRPGLVSRLKTTYARYQLVDQHIDQHHKTQDQRVKKPTTDKEKMMQRLTHLKGVGVRSAWILVTEVFGWRKFNNRKQAGSYTGLTPTPFASGERIREQGISKAGNARIRWLMVELAWLWVYWQPHSELTRWFNKRVAHGGSRMKRISIVALARKLFLALWRYVTQGVAPQGAILIFP
jgi:transposase